MVANGATRTSFAPKLLKNREIGQPKKSKAVACLAEDYDYLRT